MSTPLPWHDELWQRQADRLRADRLPHALLLTGPAGLGKRRFADRLAAAVLCGKRDAAGNPCGACPSCRYFQAGSHPDFFAVGLDYDAKKDRWAKALKIDQIRGLSASLALSAQLSGYRVAVIEPADRLNPNAANALLKTLEEPGRDSLLILVSAEPSRLPATIRSRCQALVFAPPSAEQGGAWLAEQGVKADRELLLALAGGAPLLALAMAETGVLAQRGQRFQEFAALAAGRAEPVATARAWLKAGSLVSGQWLAGWVMDMIRLRGADGAGLRNPDLADALRGLAQPLDLPELYARLDQATETLGLLAHSEVNPQLLLEDLLIPWAAKRK